MNTETDLVPEMQPAGFWIRVLASLVDSILILVVTLPILYAIYGQEYFASQALIKGPAHFLISYVFPAIAVIAFWLLARGTPGKLMCGLRVVDAKTGDTLALWQAIVRYLGYFVSLLPVFLGYIWVGIDKRKQGFHDKMAGSLVIRKMK